MTSLHTSFKTITRAAVVALALGATTLTAAPAFAQDAPSGFTLQLPGGDTQRSQTFGNGPGPNHGGWDDDYGFRCLTNREVRRGIAAYGFRRVEIVRELRRDRVEVRAVYGNWLYSMRVDKCTGEVNRVRRIGRVFGGGFDGGGFGLQFNFGN